MRVSIIFISIATLFFASCSEKSDQTLRYFEVGINGEPDDWRDSSFVVATANPQLVTKIIEQLNTPVDDRQIVIGDLATGSGGYNKNAGHTFNWHFKENGWNLVDLSVEIYDGRAYSDVHENPTYWQDTMKRFSPWGSYIKKEIFK
jgi:hypothetical protein